MWRDTCTINANDGTETFNSSTGEYTTGAGTQVFSGSCQIHSASSNARIVETAGDIVELTDYLVKIPATEADVEIDYLVTVDSSLDSSLTGRVLRVKWVQREAWAPNRYLLCEELE